MVRLEAGRPRAAVKQGSAVGAPGLVRVLPAHTVHRRRWGTEFHGRWGGGVGGVRVGPEGREHRGGHGPIGWLGVGGRGGVEGAMFSLKSDGTRAALLASDSLCLAGGPAGGAGPTRPPDGAGPPAPGEKSWRREPKKGPLPDAQRGGRCGKKKHQGAGKGDGGVSARRKTKPSGDSRTGRSPWARGVRAIHAVGRSSQKFPT